MQSECDVAKILVVDDDHRVVETVKDWLTFKRHLVECVYDGREACENIKVSTHDLLILDWDLPGMKGVEICRTYREHGGQSPVLMLTGKSEITDKEAGFEAGADDYLTKPFNVRELGARVDALLRRPVNVVAPTLQAGDLVLDLKSRRLLIAGQDVSLEPKEFAVLELLLKHKNEVFSPHAMLERIWPSASESSLDTVRTCVKKLRQKISAGDPESIIKTVHRLGYTIRADASQYATGNAHLAEGP